MRSAVQGTKTVTSFKNLSPEEAAELSRELDALEKLRESAELRSPLGLHDLKQHAWRASWLPKSIRPRAIVGATATYAAQLGDSFYVKRGKRAGRQVLCIEIAPKELLTESAKWVRSLLKCGEAATAGRNLRASKTGETYCELRRRITGYAGHSLRCIGLVLNDDEMPWSGVRLGADAATQRHENEEGFWFNDLWFTDLLLERKHPQAEAVADYVYGKALAAAGPELLPELEYNFAALWAYWGPERIQSLREAIDRRSQNPPGGSLGGGLGPALLVLVALLCQCSMAWSPIRGTTPQPQAELEANLSGNDRWGQGMFLCCESNKQGHARSSTPISAVAATKVKGGAQQQAATDLQRNAPTTHLV